MHATGDPQVLAHLRIRDGTIEDGLPRLARAAEGRDRHPARPEFRKFILAGTGKLNLNGLNQPSLEIKMAGVGTITANGKVDDLSIDMAGVSKADFGKVTGRKPR